jgi:hypothetical protein
MLLYYIFYAIAENKNPPFLEAGFIIRFNFYYKLSPPKIAGIIITTTIMIAAYWLMTILTLRFNMSECSMTNVRPPFQKNKELRGIVDFGLRIAD